MYKLILATSLLFPISTTLGSSSSLPLDSAYAAVLPTFEAFGPDTLNDQLDRTVLLPEELARCLTNSGINGSITLTLTAEQYDRHAAFIIRSTFISIIVTPDITSKMPEEFIARIKSNL